MKNGRGYIRGKHKFECQYCHGWYLSDKKRIRYDNLVVCQTCWFPKPWFMHKMPNIGNELKVVNHPSPAPEYRYVSDGESWENIWYAWEDISTDWEDRI